MEIRTLRYFAAVAHEGTITCASVSLHISHETHSHQTMLTRR